MSIRIIQGDVREELPKLPADYFDCIVTSPPYFGLRDYGCDGQIGLEATLDEYLETMVAVCRQLRRVLKPSGIFFINIGDSYASQGGQGQQRHWDGREKNTETQSFRRTPSGTIKPKDLCLVPERLGIALQQDGWWVRSHIIWAKPNPMPESVTDRPTSAHETIWMLTKNARYFWDGEAVAENAVTAGDTLRITGDQSIASGVKVHGNQLAENYNNKIRGNSRNIRNVWSVASHPFPGAHFATMPPEIVERCIKAGSPRCGHVLDPFAGAGTTGLVADRLGRDATLIDLNTSYIDMAVNRIRDDAPLFAEVAAG